MHEVVPGRAKANKAVLVPPDEAGGCLFSDQQSPPSTADTSITTDLNVQVRFVDVSALI